MVQHQGPRGTEDHPLCALHGEGAARGQRREEVVAPHDEERPGGAEPTEEGAPGISGPHPRTGQAALAEWLVPPPDGTDPVRLGMGWAEGRGREG